MRIGLRFGLRLKRDIRACTDTWKWRDAVFQTSQKEASEHLIMGN